MSRNDLYKYAKILGHGTCIDIVSSCILYREMAAYNDAPKRIGVFEGDERAEQDPLQIQTKRIIS